MEAETRESRFPLKLFSSFTLFVVLLLALVTLLAPTARAADPASGTIEPTLGDSVEWDGTAIGGVSDGESTCEEGVNCDTFILNVSGSAADWADRLIFVTLSWTNEVNDYDLVIHKDSVDGPVVASSGSGFTTSELAFINPSVTGSGDYAIHVVYFAATEADQYSGAATTVEMWRGLPNPAAEAPPRYFNYAAPGGLGTGAGEPTLGVNWDTGNVMYISGLQSLRIGFDNSSSPAQTSWFDVSALNTSIISFDPILFTDSDVGEVRTNRTFVSQLLFPAKESLMSFTDDDGDSWTMSQGAGINSGVDHQTVGGGPYAKNADGTLKGGAVQKPGPNGQIYPHATYYASQDVGLAEIARSDDGGFTFGLAVPMWTLVDCGGLHGQIKVARDGTVYVPNKNCDNKQAVLVSEDNGVTWDIRHIPDSTKGENDPSVGIGEDGTIYVGYVGADGHARIAVSHDRGNTWVNDFDVGEPVGVQNAVFPSVAAGDSDRAAYFFLGTTTGGNATSSDPEFTGTWYGYIATTYDSGATWHTVNATAGDPVQRGSICMEGFSCPSTPVNTRNLLDFNDITIDAQGRALASYADGCITSECIQGQDRNDDGAVNSFDNDGTELATVIQQSGGFGLLSEYDSLFSRNVPDAPHLIAGLDETTAHLGWSVPDDGGSDINGYNVYRGAADGTFTLIATVDALTTTYSDSPSSTDTPYRVSALNANGEGLLSNEVFPVVLESSCRMPGITVAVDSTDGLLNSPPVPQVDIESLHIAEPFFEDGSNRLVFTLEVGAGEVPAHSQWYIIWNRAEADEDHDRNYVAAKSDLSGALSFEHGRINYPINFLGPEPNQGNTPTKFGDIEGSYDPATGTITMIVHNEQVDNPSAGDTLVGLTARTFFGRSDELTISQLASSDFVIADTYTLVGNAACQEPPEAPTNLVATSPKKGKPTGEITLTWTDNSDSETQFLIERSTQVDGGFEQIATVGADVTTYVDGDIQRKVTYYYRVRAAGDNGLSGYSNVASARAK